MSNYRAPVDDIKFILQNVLNIEALWQSLPALSEVDFDTADAILQEAAKISQNVIAPLNREADEEGCRWSEHGVETPVGFKEAYQTLCEGGWCGLGGNPEYDGMGMPKSLVAAVEELIQGSCMSFGLAPMLTAGACLAIDAHAETSLKQRYLPKMYSGEWSGAMDLTEPHCGTDLGLIRTKAVPNEDGSYSLSGTKIFITWGEHDMTENIIHLVLAKLPGAPAGTKGISLFLVPKFHVTDDGTLGERNAVFCGSLEKKMGIKASATCVMNYDGAKGWLVGEANKGLACMFTMMNYERLTVGVQAQGVAENAYQAAVAYARDRLQSRSVTGVKNPDKEADPIIVHADVRRMLMSMRVLNEGGRAFYLYVAQWLDIQKYTEDEAQGKKASAMVALLTPIAKAFMTDVSLDAAILGQQVFGGHGYIREWGQEQHVRDIRITQIYEGTNGIQAMDLVGRKTVQANGELLHYLIEEISHFIDSIPADSGLTLNGSALKNSIAELQAITQKIISESKSQPDILGAVAVDYLHFIGYVIYGYLWLRMAHVAETDDSGKFQHKIALANYFFQKHLPQTLSLQRKIEAGVSELLTLSADQF